MDYGVGSLEFSIEDQKYLVNLPYHLICGRMAGGTCEILTDYDFFEHKLELSGIMELVGDYEYAFQSRIPLGAENEESLSLIQKALQLSAHVLSVDKTQLHGQLLGRLWSSNLKPVKSLLDQAGDQKRYPHLCPLGPILISPDTPLLKTITAHTEGVGGVNAMILTHDGNRLVSAGRSIKVWKAADGSFIKAIDGHSLGINALALSRDDRYLVSASNDATLKVWDFENGQELMTLAGHGGPVTAVVITPDGQHAVSAAHFSGSRAEDYEPHDNPLIVWGRYLVCAGSTSSLAVHSYAIEVFDLMCGKLISRFLGDTSVYSIATGPNGAPIVAGTALGEVHFLELKGL